MGRDCVLETGPVEQARYRFATVAVLDPRVYLGSGESVEAELEVPVLVSEPEVVLAAAAADSSAHCPVVSDAAKSAEVAGLGQAAQAAQHELVVVADQHGVEADSAAVAAAVVGVFEVSAGQTGLEDLPASQGMEAVPDASAASGASVDTDAVHSLEEEGPGNADA